MSEMTIEEAAVYLNVSPQTVRNYISKNMLTPLFGPLGKGPGKPVRVSSEEVKNFFRRNEDGSFDQNEEKPPE